MFNDRASLKDHLISQTAPRCQADFPIGGIKARKFVKGMAEGVAKLKGGEETAVQAFIDNARKYSEMLLQHIHKEDNILYPIADTTISEPAAAELDKAFDKVEVEVIGPGCHERYHQLLRRLAAEYPQAD